MDDPSPYREHPPAVRRTDTEDPHRSRARALKVLFQADLRGADAEAVLAQLDTEASGRAMLDDPGDLTAELQPVASPGSAASAEAGESAAIDGFTRSLVLGVAAHREAIDALISRFARRWAISRMPVVDRTVLRLATYELMHEPTPPAVVIDEAVGLAKALSTEDSGRYVNGVLESIRRSLAATREDRPSA